MKFVYLANNRIGYQVLKWLVEQGDRPVGVVVHPEKDSKFRKEILDVAELPSERILEGPALSSPEGVPWLRTLEPDWTVSVYFGFLLKEDVLSVPRFGTVNLHPALLPHNRGAYPNVWSIVDHTPAGVTLHFVDPGIDTGDIIAQREVPVDITDTGATLYARTEAAAFELFCSSWSVIKKGDVPRHPQKDGGTFHRRKDVEKIDRIDPNATYRAGDLIDILRARTFSPYKGAYLDIGSKRVYLRLELWSE